MPSKIKAFVIVFFCALAALLVLYLYNANVKLYPSGYWTQAFNEKYCLCGPPRSMRRRHGDLAAIYSGLKVYAIRFGGGMSYPPHNGGSFVLCLIGIKDKERGCPNPELHSSGYFKMTPFYNNDSLFSSYCGNVVNIWRGPKDSSSIFYRPHITVDDIRSLKILVCEDEGHSLHAKNGGHVLYEDGSIRLLLGEEYRKALSLTVLDQQP